MPATESERKEIRGEAERDVLALFLGILKRLMPEEEALRMYMSLAGDDEAETRRRIGLYCANLEHKISRKTSRTRGNIEKCYRFALKATTTEERDTWNDKIRIHVNAMNSLAEFREEVLKVLAIAVPWPDLIRSGLSGAHEGRANVALVPPGLMRQLDRTLADVRKLPAPPPPPEGEVPPEGQEPPSEGQETEDTEAPT